MRDFILTRSATILCPHGGIVTHVPLSYSEYQIEGQPPMLLTDQYLVSGCPFMIGAAPNPCMRVMWVNPSMMMFVRGIPVLLRSSSGIVMDPSGTPLGAAIVASCQMSVREPDEVTNVN